MWQLSNDKICPKFFAISKFQHVLHLNLKTYILDAFSDFE